MEEEEEEEEPFGIVGLRWLAASIWCTDSLFQRRGARGGQTIAMQLTHSVAHEHVAASQVACLRTRVAAGWRVAARSAAAARVTAQTSADSCRLALDPKAAATAR